MRHERLLDLGRYRKYRQKGRISPRATASTGTSSLSTSPMSTSSSFFSNSQQTPLRGVAITENDLKYRSDPMARSKQNPLGETPLAKYVNNAQNSPIQPRMRSQPQTKEERRRKLQKWEKFRSAQKGSEGVDKNSVTKKQSRLPPRPVAATLFLPNTSLHSSLESHGPVPKRISIVENQSETKEILPKSKPIRRQPMDPPRAMSINTSRLPNRTQDPPTQPSPTPMSSPYPRGRSPDVTPTMQQIKTQVLNRYEQIKEESRQDSSTDGPNLNSASTLTDDTREGSCAQHPIRLDELDLSHKEIPVPRSRHVPKPLELRDSDLVTPTASVNRSGFDFSFSPKFQPQRGTRTPSPTIKFDFTPSTATTLQQQRPKSTSANYMTSTMSFDFSSPTGGTKHEVTRTGGRPQTPMTPPLPAQHQASAFNPPTSNNHTLSTRSNLRPQPPPRSTVMASRAHKVSREGSASAPKSEPRRQSRSIVHRQFQLSGSISTTSTERRDRLMEFRDETDVRDSLQDNDAHAKHPASPYSYRQTPSHASFELPSIGAESLASDFDMESSCAHKNDEVATELDQRTARMLFSKEFAHMIHKEKLREKFIGKVKKLEKKPLKCGGNGVTFVVRKRPISENETTRGEYDVINAETGYPGGLVVYKTMVMPDLETKDVTAHSFRCNQVLSEHQPTEEFYSRVAEPLVTVAKKGGFASIVLCGSTKSGKTQTMADIEEWASNDIFQPKMARRNVSLQYVEVTPKNCYDLLSPGSFVHVVNKKAGYFQLEGAKTATASNSSALIRLISNARRRLATRANVRKKSDGSSFVMCQMTIEERDTKHSGCLTILECPSTEINQIWTPSVDTSKTTSPFDALLQCVSAKITQRTISNPFRNFNNLTKLMKQSMETRESLVCVLVTVSPIASETEGTLTALSSIGNVMRGCKPHNRSQPVSGTSSNETSTATGEEELVLPRQWSNKELFSWMRKKNLMGTSAPVNINGRLAMRMTKKQLRDAFYDALGHDQASKLYVALRAENDRVARLRVKRRMSVSQR